MTDGHGRCDLVSHLCRSYLFRIDLGKRRGTVEGNPNLELEGHSGTKTWTGSLGGGVYVW